MLKKYEPLPTDLLLLADETMEVINTYIHDCEIFVYEWEDVSLGQYSLLKVSPEIVEIKNISVRPEHQRLGIGKFLLSDAMARAKERGFKSILIGTGDVMFMQLRLYQQMGFEVHDIRHRFYLVNYSQPLFENGLQIKHMILLRKCLS